MEIQQVSDLPLYEQFRVVAERWADSEAAASLLEDTKSAVLAERMQSLLEEGMAVNRAEQTVKASQEWKDHIEVIIECRKVANRDKVLMEYLRMKFQSWMSQEANSRTEARL
jgi:hypothetical protein